MDHFANAVRHFTRLAMDPGWIDEARHSVKKLETEHPELYKGLGAAVKAQIDSLESQRKNGG